MPIKKNNEHVNICTALLTLALVVTALYGFYVTNSTTRLQTSMNFCTEVYPTLQSHEFVEREQYILHELGKRGENSCAIEDIQDAKLRREIYAYCEYMNGIGIMVYEDMINTSVIIPYIGVNSIFIYRKLRPYLNKTRDKRGQYYSTDLTYEENKKIQKAAKLYFVHYELLVLRMEEDGEKWTKRFQKELNRHIK